MYIIAKAKMIVFSNGERDNRECHVNGTITRSTEAMRSYSTWDEELGTRAFHFMCSCIHAMQTET